MLNKEQTRNINTSSESRPENLSAAQALHQSCNCSRLRTSASAPWNVLAFQFHICCCGSTSMPSPVSSAQVCSCQVFFFSIFLWQRACRACTSYSSPTQPTKLLWIPVPLAARPALPNLPAAFPIKKRKIGRQFYGEGSLSVYPETDRISFLSFLFFFLSKFPGKFLHIWWYRENK